MSGSQAEVPEKECPTVKIDGKTGAVLEAASGILEMSMDIESFLVGPHALDTSEKDVKNEPVGWYQEHWDTLDNILGILNSTIECLRTIKSTYK